jgi:hypothetical protein
MFNKCKFLTFLTWLFHLSYQQSNLETQHLIHCCQKASAVAQQLTKNEDLKTITHQVWKLNGSMLLL